MAAIYVRWIKAGKMTLDDVPDKWRESVAEMLERGDWHGNNVCP